MPKTAQLTEGGAVPCLLGLLQSPTGICSTQCRASFLLLLHLQIKETIRRVEPNERSFIVSTIDPMLASCEALGTADLREQPPSRARSVRPEGGDGIKDKGTPLVMLRKDSLAAGLEALPSSSASFVLHGEQKPQADPTSDLFSKGEAEGPAGALRGFSLQRPARGRPAVKAVSLLLVYSVAAAAAFLLALCFRRLRPKRGGDPLGGPQKRFLAERQHPRGPPRGPNMKDDSDAEDDAFLSYTLESCLDMEAAVGAPPVPLQPLPPSEEEVIDDIMWDLKKEAMLFQLDQMEAQEAAEGSPQTLGLHPPTTEQTYPSRVAVHERDPRSPSGSLTMIGDDGKGAPAGPLRHPHTPLDEGPEDAFDPSWLLSLLQMPRGLHNPAAAAAAAGAAADADQRLKQQGRRSRGGVGLSKVSAPPAHSASPGVTPELTSLPQQQSTTSKASTTAAAATAAQGWPQHHGDPQEVGGPLRAPAHPVASAGDLQGLAAALAMSILLQQQPSTSQEAAASAATPTAAANGWQQQHGGPQGGGGPQRVGASVGAPAPPAEGLHGSAAPLTLVSSLPQQPPSSSPGAVAAGDSGALSTSSHQEEGDSEPVSSKKRKRDHEEAKESIRVYEASSKKPEGELPLEMAAAYRGTSSEEEGQKVTTALLNTDKATSSSVEVGRAFVVVSPWTLGTGAAFVTLASGTTRNEESPSASGQAQASGPGIWRGPMSIVLYSGEIITFPHPPLPTPVDAPAHYRLPFVPPGAIRTQFRTEEAFSGPTTSSAFLHLRVIRNLLLRPVLNSSEVEALVLRCQALVRQMMNKCLTGLDNEDPFKIKERLGLRFLMFEAVVNCIQLLGPAMRPEAWFPHLVAIVPTEFEALPGSYTLKAVANLQRAQLLVQGLRELTRGRRPSLRLTTQIKTMLFSPGSAPRNIPKSIRKEWWPQPQEPMDAEKEESEETTSPKD
ncbi:hypothetical protein ACSSS7_007378 [Eimeria intestinalis]